MARRVLVYRRRQRFQDQKQISEVTHDLNRVKRVARGPAINGTRSVRDEKEGQDSPKVQRKERFFKTHPGSLYKRPCMLFIDGRPASKAGRKEAAG
jgi:hypothetical protein